MGLRASSLAKPKLQLFSWTPVKPDSSQSNTTLPISISTERIPTVKSDSEPIPPVDVSRRCRNRCRRSRPRHKTPRFGYEITDLDAFLSKASIETPGNIPVVLSSPCQLYQTQVGGYQEELSLPLGMVVNAVFKNQSWLYVQTPHGEEGYVRYAACLPLGILPPRAETAPCWESHSDIFPKPLGRSRGAGSRAARSECGEPNCEEGEVDRLYLEAVASGRGASSPADSVATTRATTTRRQTLLVVTQDYPAPGPSSLTVTKGDVVALVSARVRDWFWVRDSQGREGFIPASVAGHGFL